MSLPPSMVIRRQRGALTLLVGLMLLMGSSILTLGAVRIGLMEQRMANNELRAKEAHQAAQAGLEYGLAWLTLHPPEPGIAIPAPPAIAASGDYIYRAELTVDEASDCLRVRSQAQAIDDENNSAIVSECLQQKRLLNDAMGEAAPPLVVNGCVSGISESPEVYPRQCHLNPAPDCESIAVASSRTVSCLETGNLDLNGGEVEAHAFEGSAWDYLFAADKEEVKALAGQPSSNVRWITSSSDWNESLGSAASPVFLIFDQAAGCPVIRDGVTIYGIVYFEQMDGCDSGGWGAAAFFGSVVFEGPWRNLAANSVFRHWDWASEQGSHAELNPVQSTHRIPGSWRDWEP
jgi:Tfp pilus assembly protein PilX